MQFPEIVKQDGMREPFRPHKLLMSLIHSGAEKAIAESIVAHIESEVADEAIDQILTHQDTRKRSRIHPQEIFESVEEYKRKLYQSGIEAGLVPERKEPT